MSGFSHAFFFFSSRRRHTISDRDWSSDVCSSDPRKGPQRGRGTAMKTVPTLRVVSKSDAPAKLDELGVADLPAEVRLALADIAGAAREGLLAMSVRSEERRVGKECRSRWSPYH